MKYCPRCQKIKPKKRFYANASRSDGRDSQCIDCKKLMQKDNPVKKLAERKYRKKHKKRLKKGHAKWRVKNSEHVIAYRKKYQRTARSSIRNTRLQTHYGITLDDYNALLKAQKHVCAICKKPECYSPNGKPRNLSVDHCHRTEKIRGLLCNKCNQALGLFQDNIQFLKNAIKYLIKHGAR